MLRILVAALWIAGLGGVAGAQTFNSLQECERALADQYAEMNNLHGRKAVCMRQTPQYGVARLCNLGNYTISSQYLAWAQCENEDQNLCDGGQRLMAIKAECSRLRGSSTIDKHPLTRLNDAIESGRKAQSLMNEGRAILLSSKKDLQVIAAEKLRAAGKQVTTAAMNSLIDSNMKELFPSWGPNGAQAMTGDDKLKFATLWNELHRLRKLGANMDRSSASFVQQLVHSALERQVNNVLGGLQQADLQYRLFGEARAAYDRPNVAPPVPQVVRNPVQHQRPSQTSSGGACEYRSGGGGYWHEGQRTIYSDQADCFRGCVRGRSGC